MVFSAGQKVIIKDLDTVCRETGSSKKMFNKDFFDKCGNKTGIIKKNSGSTSSVLLLENCGDRWHKGDSYQLGNEILKLFPLLPDYLFKL